MKKLAILTVLFFSISVWSCKSPASSENKETVKDVEKTEVCVLDTKDAMMEKLADYKITIPEIMVYRTVDKQVYLDSDFEEKDTYLIYFDAKGIDDMKKDELLKWYDAQRISLKDNGWTEKSFEKDKEMMGGGSYSVVLLEKKSENCELDMRLSFMDEGATISIHPKYKQ